MSRVVETHKTVLFPVANTGTTEERHAFAAWFFGLSWEDQLLLSPGGDVVVTVDDD